MDGNSKSAISAAIVRILKPLMRILLRNGIPYRTFAELAKWSYVDIASREFGITGRKQSISRVSVLSGLTRKEVSRLLKIVEPDDLGATDRYHRAIRVLTGWRNDPLFLDRKGQPRDIPFEGNSGSFTALVKAYSGDIPPRAVLDEMVRAGIVEVRDKQLKLLKLVKPGYIVSQDVVDKLRILGVDVNELISTIDHNIINTGSETFLQRKASYDNIPESLLPGLRVRLRKMGEEFIESADRLISRYDRDVQRSFNENERKNERKKAGIGIFYFE